MNNQQQQEQSQRITSKLIMATNILQLSSLELRQTIEQELAENPALECPEDQPCSNCDLAPGHCGDCPLSRPDADTNVEDKTSPTSSVFEFERVADQSPDDEAGEDFASNVTCKITLQEHLLAAVRTSVDEEQREVAAYIAAHIDDSGYLNTAVEQISLDLNVDMRLVLSALTAIQSLDPPGVGARDLRECLSIQLARLADESDGNEIATAIVTKCWNDMLSGRYEKTARRLKVPLQKVMSAVSFIKGNLAPYPGNRFREIHELAVTVGNDAICPDIIVKRTTRGFVVDVVTHDTPMLSLNPRYMSIYEDIRNGGKDNYSKEEREHIIAFVDRARDFIKNLDDRRKTIKRITESIVEFQQGFLETDSRAFLRPLTRTSVARKLNMHESTVSRAAQGKYVQLPTQEVVPFDTLFDTSSPIRDAIGRIVAAEDPKNPLSDDKIASQLADLGFSIARRTVLKYREQEKILSSRRRHRV